MVYVYECMLPERSTLSSIHDVTHKPAPYGTIEGTKRQTPKPNPNGHHPGSSRPQPLVPVSGCCRVQASGLIMIK